MKSKKLITVVLLMLSGTVYAVESIIALPIENASFEEPALAPEFLYTGWPYIDAWTEIDNAPLRDSVNTGVFLNLNADTPGHIVNAHGKQLAFLGSELGNALEQDVFEPYRPGCGYRMTVAVGVSGYAPAMGEFPDTLEVALYYLDQNEPVDINVLSIPATGLTPIALRDFSVRTPAVEPNDPWAHTTIGVAIRATGAAGGFWNLDDVRLEEILPETIPVANASFEEPALAPEFLYTGWPSIDTWSEIDNAPLGDSVNTGVFLNLNADSPGHIINAHGKQLAFLGSELGNALEQALDLNYKEDNVYRLTLGVGVSGYSPAPHDQLEIALTYHDGNDIVDLAMQTIDANDLSSTELRDVSVYLYAIDPNAAWIDQPIGIALRANGAAGGFWNLDYVRLGSLLALPDPNEEN